MPVIMKGSPTSPPRDEMGAARDMIAAKRRAQIEEENKVYKEHLANAKPTIDDDTEDDATGEARARLRVESAAARQAAEAERKAKAREFHAKIKAATTVTDDWMDTEAAALARDRMASESKARKAAEQAAINEANKAMAERLSKVKALTDDDISDEQAVRYKPCLPGHSQSHAHTRTAPASPCPMTRCSPWLHPSFCFSTSAPHPHNRTLLLYLLCYSFVPSISLGRRRLLARISQGAAREQKAAEAMARRKAEIEKRERENAEMKKRLQNVQAVTDDDVMDEAAGAARATMAAESKARKAAEEAKLAKENAIHDEKIANTHAKTDDGDGIQF